MTQKPWGRGLRVRGRIDSIPPSNIGPIFRGMVFVAFIGMLLVIAGIGRMTQAKAEEFDELPGVTFIYGSQSQCEAVGYGSKVVYFKCLDGRAFADALADYLKLHPEREVSSMTADDSLNGYGYVVVFIHNNK